MAKSVVTLSPGVCGFDCKIQAEQTPKKSARITITESECAMIQKLSLLIHEVSLQELFSPLTKNVIFIAVEKAGCHLACPVSMAIVKACEVALGLAVPRDAAICFSDHTRHTH